MEQENGYEQAPGTFVGVRISQELAEQFLGTRDMKKFYEVHDQWPGDPSDVSQLNVNMIGVFMTDSTAIAGELVLGAQVLVSETPCPMCSCNSWIQNIPGTIMWIGQDDMEFYALQSAEPTVNYYWWLQ